VTLLCDSGERYRHTYYSESWLQQSGLGCQRERAAVAVALDSGVIPGELSSGWRLAGKLKPA
jgi:cysteine synthase A